ncbi:hypothetical protein FOCC_FOCC003116, partial [Frankliniella occidentalis]
MRRRRQRVGDSIPAEAPGDFRAKKRARGFPGQLTACPLAREAAGVSGGLLRSIMYLQMAAGGECALRNEDLVLPRLTTVTFEDGERESEHDSAVLEALRSLLEAH